MQFFKSGENQGLHPSPLISDGAHLTINFYILKQSSLRRLSRVQQQKSIAPECNSAIIEPVHSRVGRVFFSFFCPLYWGGVGQNFCIGPSSLCFNGRQDCSTQEHCGISNRAFFQHLGPRFFRSLMVLSRPIEQLHHK